MYVYMVSIVGMGTSQIDQRNQTLVSGEMDCTAVDVGHLASLTHSVRIARTKRTLSSVQNPQLHWA